jgi:hypothetical protein
MSYTGGLNAFGLHQYDFAKSFFGEGTILPQASARILFQDAFDISVGAVSVLAGSHSGLADVLIFGSITGSHMMSLSARARDCLLPYTFLSSGPSSALACCMNAY